MLIHPSPSRNNIKRSLTQFSSPSRSPKLFSGQCLHAQTCMYECSYSSDVHKYITHPILSSENGRERESKRKRAAHHMVGELSARITRATHLSYICVRFSVSAFSTRNGAHEFRLIDGWMDDAGVAAAVVVAVAGFFSRYLDAHFQYNSGCRFT